MTQPSIMPTTPAREASAPWRERTLERLVQHVRAVLPVSAVVFLPERSSGGQQVGWFADERLRDAMEASAHRLARGRALLLPRVEAWQAAPELMDAIAAELGMDRARKAWAAFRT